MGGSDNPISLFRLTTSAGDHIDQPIRPNERFSGVLAIQLDRPISATQIVVDFSAAERRYTRMGSSENRFLKTPIFTNSVVVWKAQQKGAVASTVLSDGIHVFNFSCQMPHLNYPQSIQRSEFDIIFQLEAKIFAPKPEGGEHIAAQIETGIFYAPYVAQTAPTEPISIAETLCFEKKGKKTKPAVELRASMKDQQVMPGTKVAICVSIKELTNTHWTKVIARLYERTTCRGDSRESIQPLWSMDRELANAELVRSSVYNFYVQDEVIGRGNNEITTLEGDPISSETLIFPIPNVACSPLNSEHLEFAHFIRLEVVLPNWLSSDRAVYTDIPVKLTTCEILGVPRKMMSRQASLNNLRFFDRNAGSDDVSTIASGISGGDAQRAYHSPNSSIDHGIGPTTVSSLAASSGIVSQVPVVTSMPPRYCDVHPSQRPAPILQLLKQANSNMTDSESEALVSAVRRMSLQSLAVTAAMNAAPPSLNVKPRLSIDPSTEEMYRSRPLPMTPTEMWRQGGPPSPISQQSQLQSQQLPPPLPGPPMPTANAAPSVQPTSQQQHRSVSPLVTSATASYPSSPLGQHAPWSASQPPQQQQYKRLSPNMGGNSHPQPPSPLSQETPWATHVPAQLQSQNRKPPVVTSAPAPGPGHVMPPASTSLPEAIQEVSEPNSRAESVHSSNKSFKSQRSRDSSRSKSSSKTGNSSNRSVKTKGAKGTKQKQGAITGTGLMATPFMLGGPTGGVPEKKKKKKTTLSDNNVLLHGAPDVKKKTNKDGIGSNGNSRASSVRSGTSSAKQQQQQQKQQKVRPGSVSSAQSGNTGGTRTPKRGSGNPMVNNVILENSELDNAMSSDDDAGYFKSSLAKKSIEREMGNNDRITSGIFRLRKNSVAR